MPTTKAAAKGLRQSLTRAKRNARAKAALEVAIRAFRKAVGANDGAKAAEAYRAVVKLTDKAAGRRIVPKNRAARIKSRLAAILNAPKSAR
jgi:small subunit ribosomal protein S20